MLFLIFAVVRSSNACDRESLVSVYLKVCSRIVSASLSGILNMFEEKKRFFSHLMCR